MLRTWVPIRANLTRSRPVTRITAHRCLSRLPWWLMNELLEAFTRLQAFRANLPTFPLLFDPYVSDFIQIHGLIAKATGADLSGYMPQVDIFPDSQDFRTGKVKMGHRVLRDQLLMKVDALLALFEVYKQTEGKPQIGFRK